MVQYNGFVFIIGVVRSKKGRGEAVDFFKFVLWSINGGLCDEPHMITVKGKTYKASTAVKNSSVKTNKSCVSDDE